MTGILTVGCGMKLPLMGYYLLFCLKVEIQKDRPQDSRCITHIIMNTDHIIENKVNDLIRRLVKQNA